MLKGLSVEEVKTQEKAAAEGKANQKKFLPDLKGLKNIGDKVFVQFINVHGVSDLVSYHCHTVHIKKKDGSVFPLTVPCLNKNSDDGAECPLCKCTNEGETSYKNGSKSAWKEKDTSLILPLIMVNLNMKFDPEQGKFVAKQDYTNGQMVDIGPQLVQRKNTSKRFMNKLVGFVEKEGDLTGKVVCIEKTRFVDGNGNPSNKGNNLDDDYTFSICKELQPVDTAQFNVPTDSYEAICKTYANIFAEKTLEEMNRYVNTGSFYEKKDGGENTTATANVTPRAEAIPAQMPDVAPTEDLSDLPGVNYRRG